MNFYVRRAEHMVEVIPKLAQLIAPPGFKAEALVVESQPLPAPAQQEQQHCAISTTQTGAVRNLKAFLKQKRIARRNNRQTQPKVTYISLPDNIRIAQDEAKSSASPCMDPSGTCDPATGQCLVYADGTTCDSETTD